ncbi:Exo_endo_phos domain-containing protein [Cephalotus follicularis]|uniref:Exo_endo_phos domain-containing protein n=1 Tax=Cephalotus follicularis TaxID=3775 RepID=A0A1Q3CZC4_CEPFO|nr:Exo_endo_phos domain-containing protein [Cephalotus follicularis]
MIFQEAEFYVLVVCGSCDYRERRDLWANLVHHSQRFKSMPWVILGDFNVSRWPNEHSGGRPMLSKAIREFSECIKKCELQDLRQAGFFFSWSNKRTGVEAMSKKIDRVMGNWGWFKEFNHVKAMFPSMGISNHSPCIIQFKKAFISSSCPFKYLNVWASYPSFLDVVKQVWPQTVEASPLEAVRKKLRILKPVLKEFHTRHFNNLATECTRLKQLIEIQQASLDEDPTNEEARSNEKKLLDKYNAACWKEESYLKQKARVNWLKLGNSNSAFFHRAVKMRQARNSIDKIQKANGEWTKSQKEVGEESVKFFTDLFLNPLRQ